MSLSTFTRNPASIGVIGMLLITIGSFGAGSVRYRGGIVDALGLSVITYGHAFAVFEILIWIGLVLVLASWLLVGRELIWNKDKDPDRSGTSGRLSSVNRTLIWWLIPLSFAGPLFSRDVYSYLMQGAMVRDGFDPYTQGPAANPGPMLLEVSADWRNTTTPYGPLHLGIGDVITSIFGDNIVVGVIIFRILSILGLLAIAWSVPRIALKIGGDPVLAQWLGVLNPLVVLHLVGGLHNEAIMVGLVSLALLCSLSLPSVRGVVAASVLVGLAIALKATAIIALPFLVWIALTRTASLDTWKETFRRAPQLLASGIGMVAGAVATIAAVTWITGTSWGWLTEISGNTKVINPLAFPSAVAGAISGVLGMFSDNVSFNAIVEVTRIISMVIMLVGLVVVWFMFRQNPLRNVAGICAAYAVAVVFNSVTLPWYYASLLTFIGAIRPRRWVVQLTVIFTFILTLSFAGGGNNRFYEPIWMLAITIAAILSTRWLVTGSWRNRMNWRGAHGDGEDSAVNYAGSTAQ